MKVGIRVLVILVLIGATLAIPIRRAAWTSRLTFVGQPFALPPLGIYTYHYDNTRSGLNPNETILNPSNVNLKKFGLLFTDSVVGVVYAQPLYVPSLKIGGHIHNVVYIATENDNVYAFDADRAGAALSSTTLLGKNEQPLQTSDLGTSGCGSILPLTGITGTPVIDPDTNTLYVSEPQQAAGDPDKIFYAAARTEYNQPNHREERLSG